MVLTLLLITIPVVPNYQTHKLLTKYIFSFWCGFFSIQLQQNITSAIFPSKVFFEIIPILAIRSFVSDTSPIMIIICFCINGGKKYLVHFRKRPIICDWKKYKHSLNVREVNVNIMQNLKVTMYKAKVKNPFRRKKFNYMYGNMNDQKYMRNCDERNKCNKEK